MCNRVFLKAPNGAFLATFNGVSYSQLSFDGRCERTLTADPVTGACILSFANSDKPGVVITNPLVKIETQEFTDAIPPFTLCIDFVDPENPGAAAQG